MTDRDSEWHFWVSATTGKIGPSRTALANLKAAGIKLVFHSPK